MFRRTPREWNQLAGAVREAQAHLDAAPGDDALAAALRAAIDALYTPEWEATLEALDEGDAPGAVEAAIDFLTADPRCFRSGYQKEKVCGLLARASLTEGQRERLAPVVDGVLKGEKRPARETKRWEKLFGALRERD